MAFNFQVRSVRTDVNTRDPSNYNFLKCDSESIQFNTTADKDVYIALTYNPSPDPPMYVVKLGIDNNTRSAIDKDATEVVSIATADALLGKSDEYWVRWDKGIVAVGREGEAKPFMSFVDEELVPIRYVGLCSKQNTRGNWSIRATPERSPVWCPGGNWISGYNGSIPPGSVVGGHEDGRNCYVARVFTEFGVIPGKLIDGEDLTYYMFDKKEHASRSYEVFCNYKGAWISAKDGDIPPQAIVSGRFWNSKDIYVARGQHKGDLITGYLSKETPACVITYDGEEVLLKEYEVLSTSV